MGRSQEEYLGRDFEKKSYGEASCYRCQVGSVRGISKRRSQEDISARNPSANLKYISQEESSTRKLQRKLQSRYLKQIPK